ncbi:MAG TPA: class I SAM-dependent methyltransferase, partial [Alphaproteobacteria bacterium]|nr:class I SAM-dependent methyltransferase [Alphaproteobacteria bacterium]
MRDIVSEAESRAGPAGPQRAAVRPPPRAVKCVVPVWGHNYVRQFLEFGLRTMLAPGNVPALAEMLPCEFVILTSYEDEPFLRQHPTFRLLSQVCKVDIRRIDHLITGTNYSTTITLAYAEAIRAEGPALTDTCFFLLVSDYIVADGSFRNVLKRVMAGASGIQVGNFQVAEQEAMPWLQDQMLAAPGALSLPSRTLMRWALSHLHPATVANIVNYPLNNNAHTNRLFWRVDGEALIGRFYLMHMICIRPELEDFVIGASCDYSFIPEICPSGNVEIVPDSDEYLVVEMQPRDHEAGFLRVGPIEPRQLAGTLSGWTTARHRENANHSVLFHAGEVSPERTAAMEKSIAAFLGDVRTSIGRIPKPHRNHPYWRGAMAAHREATGRKLTRDEWRRVMGIPDPTGTDQWLNRWVIDRIRFAVFGRPPHVRVWHPRWPDMRVVIQQIGDVLDDPRQRVLMLADTPTIFTASLADDGERTMRVRLTPFINAVAEIYQPMFGCFDLCLLELAENDLVRADEAIDRVAPLMKDGGRIVVVVYNHRDKRIDEFSANLSYHSPRLLRPAANPVSIQLVPASTMRFWILRTMMRIARTANRRPLTGVPLLLATGWFLAPACLIANLVGEKAGQVALRDRIRATSAVLTFTADGEAGRDAYKYSASRIVRQRRRTRRGLPSAPPEDAMRRFGIAASPDGERPDEAAREGTVEPQYNRCTEIMEQYGLTELGLMTNQVYHDDPRRLAILLARYKFVAKMLSGKDHVAEVGCGDAFGTRIVQQEVDRVVAYDIDPLFIQDIRRRQSSRWPIEAHVHDIVEGPLKDKYDGIYSLDVIEHIDRSDERAYLANLKESLSEDGVLIIGSPSLESQAHASPLSKEGHINCKSGAELKALLQQEFRQV